jgi:serralysin
MCTICAALRPTTAPILEADQHLTALEKARSADQPITMAEATGTQINALATQLTHGYWQFTGGGPRAFDVAAGGTLTVDLSDLSAVEQTLARQALSAWTDVTGIRFAAITPPTVTTVAEVGDVAAGIATTARMAVNQAFLGDFERAGDRDAVRVYLQAGQTYTITLEGRGSNPVNDPYLRLLGANGTILREDDDSGGGYNSQITWRATTTGYHYLQAGTYWGDETGAYRMQITRGSQAADISFSNNDTGAYAYSDLSGTEILRSYVNIEANWDTDPIAVNSYWFQTYVHEIGHALGLGHAGNYNTTADWGVDNRFAFDSWQASIMSYFSQTDNPNTGADYAYLATVMPADIVAIQRLYDGTVRTRQGDTTYGANSNVGGYMQSLFAQWLDGAADRQPIYIGNPVALTIYDTGGRDTLDFSTVGVRQTIHLSTLRASSVAGLDGNLIIAAGVAIENAIGGRAADIMVGNAIGNRLVGNGGNDVMNGGRGNDVLIGGAGADDFRFGAGRDVVRDFRDNVDEVWFDRDLWGGAQRSAQQILNSARVVDGNTVFTFGAHVLTVNGVANKMLLADDILTF